MLMQFLTQPILRLPNDILYSQKVTGKQKQRLTFFLQKSKKLLERYEYEEQRNCVAIMRSFVRFYEFLLQVSSFEDYRPS